MMKHFIFHIVLFMLVVPVLAQQQATLDQYMFNGLAINPAYAGSHEALSVTTLFRFQSVGVPGAPMTQTLSAHSPLLKQNIAVGFLMVHDKIGVTDQLGFNGVYAYRLTLSRTREKTRVLSMGLQAGLTSYKANYTELTVYDPDDPAFRQDIRTVRPNFGFGIYYYTDRMYAGISLPHLMNNIFDDQGSIETINQTNPIILNGGYVFPITRMIKLKPNMLVRFLNERPVEIDVNANLSFDDIIWVGVSYKVKSAVNFLMEIQATNQLRVGYSYSATTSSFRQVDNGSHELMLNYRFAYPKKGILSPRHF
jgi:type IX secretion system PorP/SprF family membrane protein